MNQNIFKLSLISFLAVYTISINSKIDNDKLFIFIGEETFLINLIESPITQELINLLPLKTKLLDETFSSKKMSLSIEIESSSLISSNSQIFVSPGDLLLYQGKELILVNKSNILTNEKGELFKIGHTEKVENFYNSISRNKTIYLWNNLNYENYLEKVKPYGFYTSIMNYFTWKVFTFFCFLLL